MSEFDFSAYYDEHRAYAELRDENNSNRQRYIEEIDLWKNKYFIALLRGSGLDPSTFKTVIEIGCATGDLIGRIGLKAPRKVGIDISEKNVRFAAEQYPDLEFFAGTYEEFVEQQAEGFVADLVIMSDILEHVDDDAGLLGAVGERSRHVLLNLPMEKCWINRKRAYGTDDFAGHLRAYGLDDAYDLLERAGMEAVEEAVRYFCQEPVHVRHLRNRLFPAGQGAASRLTGLAKYLVLRSIDHSVYRWYYPSNYFGLLKKKRPGQG